MRQLVQRAASVRLGSFRSFVTLQHHEAWSNESPLRTAQTGPSLVAKAAVVRPVEGDIRCSAAMMESANSQSADKAGFGRKRAKVRVDEPFNDGSVFKGGADHLAGRF